MFVYSLCLKEMKILPNSSTLGWGGPAIHHICCFLPPKGLQPFGKPQLTVGYCEANVMSCGLTHIFLKAIQ